MRLRRDGRDIFYRLDDDDADYPGEEVLLARIPDYLTPEQWERLYADGPRLTKREPEALGFGPLVEDDRR